MMELEGWTLILYCIVDVESLRGTSALLVLLAIKTCLRILDRGIGR